MAEWYSTAYIYMPHQNIPGGKILGWPHSPAHWLRDAGTYIVTAGTHGKAPFFRSPEKLNYLANALMILAEEYGWRLQAWAVFPNHYHFVAASDKPDTLRRLTQYLHSVSAKYVNLNDGTPGRRVWFQYWDTRLTHERSYLARLNYVHGNAVKHGLVERAEDYSWCSAGWFLARAPRPFYETVRRFPCDCANVPDAFEVSAVASLESARWAPVLDRSMA